MRMFKYSKSTFHFSEWKYYFVILSTLKNKPMYTYVYAYNQTQQDYMHLFFDLRLLFHMRLFLRKKWLQGPCALIFKVCLLLRCAYLWMYTVYSGFLIYYHLWHCTYWLFIWFAHTWRLLNYSVVPWSTTGQVLMTVRTFIFRLFHYLLIKLNSVSILDVTFNERWPACLHACFFVIILYDDHCLKG